MAPVTFPLAFGHWQLQGNSLLCRLPRKTVAVAAPGALLQAVLALCDGRMAWREVAAELARVWSPAAVETFLSRLTHEGALVEAGEALAAWTDIAQFPTPFPRPADPLEARALQHEAHDRLLAGRGEWGADAARQAMGFTELLQRRESHRTFADQPVPADALGAILWAAHGVTRPSAEATTRCHRTIASGGNMHGTRWFVVVLRPLPRSDGQATAVAPGLYEARFHLQGGVSLAAMAGDTGHAWRILLDPRPLAFASALLLPVCDVSRPARKYGNRATLFATLEVGQSLQNAQLMAAALQVGSIVRGDTCASAALEMLAPHLAADGARAARPLVLPCLVAGMEASRAEADLQRQGRWMTMGHAITLAAGGATGAGQAVHAFVAGPVQLGESQIYCTGRSADPGEALAKAEAETWERQGWATLGETLEGTAREITGALDPRCVVAYSARQYATRGFPCVPFSPRRKYLWVAGTDTDSGRSVHLPAECVHALSALPDRYRCRPCTNSSTSGMAAWTDAEGALCRATLELMERDAFIRSWLAAVPLPQLMMSSLPATARQRVDALRQAGYRVAVLALRPALVNVFAVFIQCVGRPFTAITAAADLQPEAALDRALDEAEGRAAHAAAFPARPLARACEVSCLEDIPRLYQSARFFRRADFYAAGPASQRFGDIDACKDWPALRTRLRDEGRQLVAFALTPAGASIRQGRTQLHVMRAVIPGLLPIWFQHGLAPAGLPAYQRAATTVRGGAGGGARLIHPFT